MGNFSVYMNEKTRSDLGMIAKKKNISISALVKVAIEEKIERESLSINAQSITNPDNRNKDENQRNGCIQD